jgi:hypothetical protein
MVRYKAQTGNTVKCFICGGKLSFALKETTTAGYNILTSVGETMEYVHMCPRCAGALNLIDNKTDADCAYWQETVL